MCGNAIKFETHTWRFQSLKTTQRQQAEQQPFQFFGGQRQPAQPLRNYEKSAPNTTEGWSLQHPQNHNDAAKKSPTEPSTYPPPHNQAQCLILVLLENTIGYRREQGVLRRADVLTLVLLEDGLAVCSRIFEYEQNYGSLKPCFNGRWTRSNA